MGEHALLSASGAHKWLNCPPSARLEEQFPESTSEYAEEGRLAHAIAELKLTKHFTPMGPRKFAGELKKLQESPRYDPEMMSHTDSYLEYIQKRVHAFSSPPHVVIEKRLNYSSVAPEGFGTGDCIIIGGNTLVIVDFKYGKGVPVSAEQNPQMMLYALGALFEYQMLYMIENVQMAIVQPRLDSIGEWEISAADLLCWGAEILPIAQLAFDGKGDFHAGEHCRFCRAKATCRARCDTMTALEAFGGAKPPLITHQELGEILLRAQTLQAWVSDLEEYALATLLLGGEIPGWKAVEGRSTRQFINTDEAFKVVKTAGYDEALLYERKPITLTAVEKLLGKKQFGELLESQVTKAPGKPALAPESDKREAITNVTTAQEAFGQAS
jgi:hypothetical protein